MPGNIKHKVGAGLGGIRGDSMSLNQTENYARKTTKGYVGATALTLPTWEDRNTDNIGSKLNGPKIIKGNLKKRPDKNIYIDKKARKKSDG